MVPDLGAESKIGAIKTLVDRLQQAGILDDSLSFLQAVLERENIESTVVHGLIALPHARCRAVSRLGMAVGVSSQPIDYPSGDDRSSVRLICLIAVPADAPRLYLGLLAALASAFGDDDFVRATLSAGTPEKMYALMSDRFCTSEPD